MFRLLPRQRADQPRFRGCQASEQLASKAPTTRDTAASLANCECRPRDDEGNAILSIDLIEIVSILTDVHNCWKSIRCPTRSEPAEHRPETRGQPSVENQEPDRTTPTRRLARSVWTLYTRDQLIAVLKALAVESNPDKRRRLQARANRYEKLLKPDAHTRR